MRLYVESDCVLPPLVMERRTLNCCYQRLCSKAIKAHLYCEQNSRNDVEDTIAVVCFEKMNGDDICEVRLKHMQWVTLHSI